MFSSSNLEATQPPARASTRRGGPLLFKVVWPGVEAALVEASVQGKWLHVRNYSVRVEPEPARRFGKA